MLALLMIALVALGLHYCFVRPQQYWRRMQVKQGPAIPLLGDNARVFIGAESLTDMAKRLYNRFKGERYCGIYQTTLPTLMLRDPELIKQITVKDFDHFVDHRQFAPENVEPIWTRNLFSLKGETWRDMRAILSPTFTASKMRAMFVLMESCARQYVDFYLQQQKEVVELELKDSLTRYANDVIATCAFGVAVDSLQEPENSFYVNGREATNLSGFWKNFCFLLNQMAPPIARFFKLSIFSDNVAWFFKQIVQDTVRMREEQNLVRPDMIHLLMEARKGQSQPVMTEEDMAAQVMIFFFAGFDTISTMMSFMCYELALHPEVQTRLHQEIADAHEANGGVLTYDVLSRMKYLEMVVSESMRKTPPVSFIDRVCTKAYTIEPKLPHEQPVHLRPGDVIWLPIAGIQQDEEFYPNPERFDPERFSDENKAAIKPYTFLAFGAGPRNCIGSRFALMEAKMLIFHLLRCFELVAIDKTMIPFRFARNQFNPTMEGGCWVGFKRRKDIISN